MEAAELRRLGNQAFAEGRVADALEKYSQALALQPNASTLYSNRARCHYRLRQFEAALHDAQRAVEEDLSNIKAHLLLGTSLCELARRSKNLQQVESAIVRLRKAVGLCSSQNVRQLENSLNTRILRAQKLKWCLEKEAYEAEMEKAQEVLRAQINADSNLSDEQRQKLFADLSLVIDHRYRITREIPDYMRCPLTRQLFSDPVLLSSGNSFEKTAIVSHLQTSGHDPLSGDALTTRAVAPNINLRQAVAQFLAENPWAFEAERGHRAEDISFED